MKKWLIVLFLFLLLGFSKPFFTVAQNDECSDKSVEDKPACLTEVLKKLSGKSETLNQEIGKRKTQIKLTSAQIAKTEQDIYYLVQKIGHLEVSLDQLSVVVRGRVVATYKKGEIDPIAMFFSSSGFFDFVSRYKYLRVIQLHDKNLLYAMETTRTNYDEQKQAIEVLKKKLESQKATLAKQQLDLEALLAITKNDEARYRNLLKKALAEVASLKRFTQASKGSILSPQQSPDGWYYSQRDQRWATKNIGYSQDTIFDVGCLISDVAMIFTFYGDRKTPADIADNTSYFYSSTAYMNTWPSPAGKNYTKLSSTADMDNELAAGRPVIVHLNLGGDGHFIVLKKKEGDDYLIHDPWYGYDLKFKDYYNISSIDKWVVYK